MNFQQLEYALALARYGNFSKAAEACQISQSTLSTLILKLENELDVVIFDRGTHPVKPTPIGEKILQQARLSLYHARQLQEIPVNEKGRTGSRVKMGIIPTIAPYVVPKLIKKIRQTDFHFTFYEAPTAILVQKIENAELDLAILATPLGNRKILEIPLYYEKLLLYTAPEMMKTNHSENVSRNISQKEIDTKRLWLLKEGHCLRNQVCHYCNLPSDKNRIFEAGSVDTLIRLVDENGGCTLLPELHFNLLDSERQKRTWSITDPIPVREISIAIRRDFIRESVLNILSECIRSFIPGTMIDNRLKKYAIRI